MNPNAKAADSGAMIRTMRTSSIVAMAAALAVVLVLLTMPIPDGRRRPIAVAVLNLGHVPLFAALALATFRFVGSGWTALAALAAAAVGGELLQAAVPGRTADWGDVGLGLAGVVLAWAWNPWRAGPPPRAAVRWLAAGAAALAVGFEGLPNVADALLAQRQFPVLCDFSTPWQERRWSTRQASWESRDGRTALVFETGPDDFPGAELIPIESDWSGYDSLVLDLELDQPMELQATIRDQRAEMGYDERFNATLPIFEGRRTFRLPLALAASAPRTRPLDLRRIDSLNLFIDVAAAPGRMIVHRIALERASAAEGGD